jgi:tetratricopeptide (TPR) repeat protein
VLERVRNSLSEGTVAGAVVGDATEHQDVAAAPTGAVRQGKRFEQRLLVQRTTGGGAMITADIAGEPADDVLRELSELVGFGLDDERPSALRRNIVLRIKDLPWPETMDRLAGQLSLRWRAVGSGAARRVVIEDASRSRDATDLGLRAGRALERVVAGGPNAPAAEAMYLMAAQELAEKRFAAALRGFSLLIDTYAIRGEPEYVPWVQQASRGAGEAMMALGAYADARIAFRSYLARADKEDRDVARIHLLAAEAARRLGSTRNDPGAYDEAVDELHRLLERFGDDPQAITEVAAARLALGNLLFESGQQVLVLPGAAHSGGVPPEAQARFREAEAQLTAWLRVAGHAPDRAPDQIAFWLAECAFNLGRADEALPMYERLHRLWKTGETDGNAPATVYPTAAYRAGECWLQRPQPDHVRALFGFLRARQDFPKSPMDAWMLIRIAQCYAELESEDQAVASLYELLRSDQAGDSRPAAQQLDQLLGELVSRLGDHPGPVRARVLFYIARAQYLHARRDRSQQAGMARQAAATYARVLDESPPTELRHAALLGQARSHFLAGEDGKGEVQLKRFLRDPTISPRDRAYAGQLLGEHLKATGRLREAIQAFRGEVAE